MDLEALKRAKREMKMTIAEIAEKANLPKGTVQNIFAGYVPNPRSDTAEFFCKKVKIFSEKRLTNAFVYGRIYLQNKGRGTPRRRLKMTKQEIIERLNKVCEASQNERFVIEARVSDWENYGKSRTYLKLVETSDTTKHYKTVDFGYFDNKNGVYVAGQRDLAAEKVYDFGGNNVVNF